MLLILRERNGDLEVPLGIIINVAEEIEIKACVIEARKRIRRRIERLLLLLMLLRPFLQYADGPSSRPWKLEGVKVGSWNLERLERVTRLYLALDGVYRPIWAAFPNNPTR